ncbi:cell surface protein [Mycobacterium gordonae]|uniref:Cell surface protein n=1 Tax=Mycobacterium gordonae TaxID=1778 RepID=A0A1A6B9C5_MYCGO|nr:fasciclin domain-containing protein [Mycobacterium gordonae]OBR98924.1 cell surface protein [Mycobacterium gordonae]
MKTKTSMAAAGFAVALMSCGVALAPTAAASDLVGPGCADYAAANPTGPASVQGMSQVPVTEAAAANPLLTTLTSALSGQLNPQVNLVDTLNSGQYTVFAPTDAAFGKLPPATIEQLKTDSSLLTRILTYHVVSGQASPNRVIGTHKTLQGDNAGVVCGGVSTANAQVYLIDTVLMPPA